MSPFSFIVSSFLFTIVVSTQKNIFPKSKISSFSFFLIF